MKQKLQFLLLFLMLFSLGVNAQNRTVTGKVTNSKGEAIPGATVVVKGTSNGVVTRTDGTFSINNVPSDAVLVIQAFGLETQEVTVGSQTNIAVSLSDTKALDEVVVVGYGTSTKRGITGSVATVKAEDIATMPTVSTFENALTGRTAGVQVNAQNGVLGAPVTVRVRGTASVNATTQPLYVVDGIPIAVAGGQSGLTFGGSGTNPLKNLNPSEIESIEVLKDASAAAIYGARASNGVILITTKRGKTGKPQISINYYRGTTRPTNTLDMLNGDQYTQMWNDAIDNRGLAASLKFDPNNVQNTDFIDLVTRTGQIQEINASVSGGNQNTKYYISAAYADANGYIERNEQQRFNLRLNLDQKISEKVSMSLGIAPSRSTSFRVGEENAVGAPWTYAHLYYPNVAAFNADGSVNLDNSPNILGQFPGTPISNQLGQDFNSTLTQVIANLSLNYQILPFLSAQTKVAIESFQIDETRKFADNTTDGFGTGLADAFNSQSFNYTWTNTVNYNQVFGKHKVSGLLGAEIQKSITTTLFAEGNEFPDNRLKTLNAASATTDSDGTGTEFTFAGIFTRLNYSFADKYIVSLTARYDGSSRFGFKNRYGFFPAASFGWVASQESFMSGIKNVVSFLKLRASYGLTGNGGIGNFASLGLVAFNNYAGTPGFEPNSLSNPDLTWETTTQLDIALEWGILNDRIRGSFGYYLKNTNDLLLNRPLPRESGFQTITQNVGEIENSGIEIELNADVIKTKDFLWTTSFNISTLQNKVKKLLDNDGDGKGDDIILGRQIIREGEPLGAFYLVNYAGVDPANGDALFFNTDGNENRDGTTTNAYSTADRVISGNPFPDFFGGWTNKFSYKGFDLSVFFQFVQGNDIYRNEGRFYQSNLRGAFNQTVDQLNYWTPTNTNTDVPQPRANVVNGNQHSTRYLDDGSFIRLKTLTFGYTLPKSLTKQYSVRFYVQGQNLWTRTDYQGFDPEVGGGNGALQGDVFFAAPQAITILGGVNINF
ncbi:MAG TPA: SusC/RagA family TonB-linked outer membrane protein [Microscillaceae bacterium]|nr:SusC/RagA family TonB-linked outer membrane protein [Microscillaceae bacterium]